MEPNTVSTSAKGTAAEMMVAADLMMRGFEVFKGLSGRESCDLIAVAAGRCYRVEVKASHPERMIVEPDAREFDLLAFALGNEVTYRGTTEALSAFSLPAAPVRKFDRSRYDSKRQARCLEYLAARPHSTVGAIAKGLGLSRPDVQNALYKLYRSGNIIRGKSGRAFVYVLSR